MRNDSRRGKWWSSDLASTVYLIFWGYAVCLYGTTHDIGATLIEQYFYHKFVSTSIKMCSQMICIINHRKMEWFLFKVLSIISITH